MTSPWITPHQPVAPTVERPWTGMAMLAAVPLLSLILVRLLWSGSSLWFLTVGIILLGSGAAVFLARRSQEPEQEQAQPLYAQESARLPMVLAALGVLFLVLLLLPNFSSADDTASGPVVQQDAAGTGAANVAGASEAPVGQQAAPAAAQPAEPAVSADGQTYVVQPGDTLFSISQSFGVAVDEIVALNAIEDPGALQIGDELILPPSTAAPAGDEAAPAE